MKVKYEVDKDKFIKVYNELKIDIGNVPDFYCLASKHDKTNDKDIKDIMYAIYHNINFEITDINAVKKINDMYDCYEKPNRLTQQEIIDCIKEVNALQLGLQTQTMATVMDVDIIGKDHNNKIKMVLGIWTNFTHSPMRTICARQGSLSDIIYEIKQFELVNQKQCDNGIGTIMVKQYKNTSDNIVGDIFKSIFNWK